MAATDTDAAPAILTVAPAGSADAPMLIDTIAGAFLNDPTWSWAFPGPDIRRRWWQLCIDGAELLRRFGEAHPRKEPHYYLSLLGTREEHRGRGLGMALLKEDLARIDAERMPAYLESSNPGNNHRYESVGFVPMAAFRAPGQGPLVTGMWRKATG